MQSVTVTRIQGLNSSSGNRGGSTSSRQSHGDKKQVNNPFRQNPDEESVNTSKGGSVNGSSNITPPQFGGRNGPGRGPTLNIDDANIQGPYVQYKNMYAQSNKNSLSSYDSAIDQQRTANPSVLSSYSQFQSQSIDPLKQNFIQIKSR